MLTMAAVLGFALAQANAAPALSDIGKSKPVGSCRMATPEQCARSGEWITADPRFKPAVIEFFKSVPKGRFGYKGEAAWEPFWRGISGPSLQPRQVAPGVHLFDACVSHACPLYQSAVVVTRGRIVAAAMAGEPYRKRETGLFLFVKKTEPLTKLAISALLLWARQMGYERPSLDVLP